MNIRFALLPDILIPTALFFLVSTGVVASPVVSERITFLNEDGIHYVRYDTTRTDHNNYEIWFGKKDYRNPERYLDNYLYLYPNEHQWEQNAQPDFDLMKIASGSFASLIQDKLDQNTEVSISEDGIYTYSNNDQTARTPDGHYGIWNKPEAFSQLVYAWVFPRNFNIVSYESNRPGKWVKRNNTITYFGDNVNDVVFTIKYQFDTNTMYRELLKAMAGQKIPDNQIQFEQSAKGVKITLLATVLFSSGSTELSEPGKAILKMLARSLYQRNDLKFIIEGHSDNVTIKGDLLKKFRSNWELSSARSLEVLHFLANEGIPESRMEARAHSQNRPVAPNDTEYGRAQNRRIEILLTTRDR